MPFVAFVLVVNRARTGPRDRADRRSGTTTDNGANRCAAGCAHTNPGDRSPHTVTSMITAMVDHSGN